MRGNQYISTTVVCYHEAMPSVRSRIVKNALKLSLLLREPVTAENLERKRAAYTRLSKHFPLPKGTKITPIAHKGFVGEWIDVGSTRKDVVILYVHGGGFVFDSSSVHRELIARIAIAAKARALSLHYSLAPENPFPVALNEALAAYQWLLKKYPPNKIVLAGDSAGGSVVLSLLHIIREQRLPNPACAVALSPATDAYDIENAMRKNAKKDFFLQSDNLNFFIDAYFQRTPRNHPVASPLYGSLKGFPPLLLHVDSDELMYDGIQKFVQKAKSEGVEVMLYKAKGLWHVWHLFARIVPEARTAIGQIGEFIYQHTPLD